jgi:hypothetical protein
VLSASFSFYKKKLERLFAELNFFDGESFARAGGSLRHSLVGTNLVRALGNHLKGKPCVPCNSDLRIKVEATGLLTYPICP